MAVGAPRLENKVAIVVGAGQTPGDTLGNGRATSLLFAAHGARTVLVDRRIDSAQETAHQIREAFGETAGDAAVALEADVTLAEDCRAITEHTLERFGRIDILHYNVGIGAGDGGPTHLDEETWQRIHDTNLKGAFLTVKHVLPVMREQRGGVLTFISSVAAICAVGLLAYKTSKAALNAMSHAIATGNAQHGIRSNVIMPGLIETPMAIEGISKGRGIPKEQLVEERNRRVPLGHMGTAWDIAYAALFLASAEAKFITGIELAVDGGQSARIG
jgi:NAD(P)-dependent dehydrogenase (short-subunit alcohol dehydrogenase family)